MINDLALRCLPSRIRYINLEILQNDQILKQKTIFFFCILAKVQYFFMFISIGKPVDSLDGNKQVNIWQRESQHDNETADMTTEQSKVFDNIAFTFVSELISLL